MSAEHLPTRILVSALLALVLAHPSAAAEDPCVLDYDETGWGSTPPADPTPGAETCLGYPDKAGRYQALAYRFDPERALLLTGDFAVARLETYIIDFLDPEDVPLAGRSFALSDLDPATGEALRPRDGSCNPAALSPPASPLPGACSPRAFAVLFVHDDDVADAQAASPDFNVVGVPDGTDSVAIVRRVYVVEPGEPDTPPLPQWCDASSCIPLDQVVPDVRRHPGDLSIVREGDPLPEDPCKGAAQGSCGETIPMYRSAPPDDAWVGWNRANEYLSAELSKLGWSDVVVFSHTSRPDAAVDYPARSALTGSEQVRYWSYCIGYRLNTRTVDCLLDSDFDPANPSQRLVIGSPNRLVYDPELRWFRSFREAVEARGDVLLTWGDRFGRSGRKLAYRNSLPEPDAPGFLGQVPVCGSLDPDDCVPASAPPPAGVGAWAPVGRHCTVRDYLRGTGACDVD